MKNTKLKSKIHTHLILAGKIMDFIRTMSNSGKEWVSSPLLGSCGGQSTGPSFSISHQHTHLVSMS